MLTERIILGPGSARDKMIGFLRDNSLGYENDVEYSFCLMDGDIFAAAGSLAGSVLKCIAVHPDYRAMGLSAQIVSALCQEAALRGRTHLFLFTKPENICLFQDMGFHPVAESPRAVLLENRKNGLARYVETLSRHKYPGSASGIVVNADPFTLGHQRLIQEAARQSDHLHVFVVGETRSLFPAADREQLVREGVRDLPNVTVHSPSPYILSAATFPSYFLKTTDEPARIHAQLDLTLFGKSIAPALGIDCRWAGEEPFSPSTELYNEAMETILPPLGVRVCILPRKTVNGEAVSASHVRQLWKENRMADIRPMVPDSTWDYLSRNTCQKV